MKARSRWETKSMIRDGKAGARSPLHGSRVLGQSPWCSLLLSDLALKGGMVDEQWVASIMYV
jgi:hypothetical protein